MVQNFVRVRQEYKHIIVKGAGGLRGETGPQGPEGPQGPQGPQGATGIQGEQGVQGIQGPKGDPGAGLVITGSVNTYADLPNDLGPDDAGQAYFVQADGKLYVWSGTAWPADGEGSQFEGPQGPQGVQGPQGIQGPQGEPGQDANVVNALSQSTTDAYSAKYINDNNYTKTETDTLLNAKAPANEVAYIGQEVAGGSTLIGTSDIAPGAITTSKVADGAITSDKIDSATYSTEEQVVGTWIDGKPLYRRVWVRNTSSGTETWIADIPNIRPIRMEGYMYNETSSGCQPLGQWANPTDSAYSSRLFCDATTFKAQVNVGWNREFYSKIRATLWYTKTTD